MSSSVALTDPILLNSLALTALALASATFVVAIVRACRQGLRPALWGALTFVAFALVLKPLGQAATGPLPIPGPADAAALLAFETQGEGVDDNSVYYFVGIDGARFKRPVEPGDQLFLDVQMDRNKGGIYKFNAQALVGEELAVSAQLMCTVRKVS